MKRWIAGLLVLSLVGAVLVAAPSPAEARYRGHRHGGGGYFWGGLAAGAITGLIVGSIVAAPPVQAAPPVVYQPQPVYVSPAPVYAAPPTVYVSPAPVCTDYYLQGYWSGGVWVAPHWERVCR
jgi:hypothetical protein